MQMNNKVSKDTFLMGTLLVAALLTMGCGSIRTSEELLAGDAALMVVKSATLIANTRPMIHAAAL